MVGKSEREGQASGIDAKWEQVIGEFIAYLEGIRHVLSATSRAYRSDLTQFALFIQQYQPGIELKEIDHIALRHFLVYLREKGVGARSLSRKLSALRRFFRFLHLQGLVEQNPTVRLDSVRFTPGLPRSVQNPEEMAIFIKTAGDLPRVDKLPREALRVRDICILQFLYGLGVRSAELVALDVGDVGRDFVQVKGKGNKERMVPIGEKSQTAFREYVKLRHLLTPKTDGALFVSIRGRRLDTRNIRYLVARIASYLGKERITPHTLRHTFATHLYEHDADLRDIQELLGHESIDTTNVYTHASITKLKEKYDRTHPHGGKRGKSSAE